MELVKALTETSSLLAASRDKSELFHNLLERTVYESASEIGAICEINSTDRPEVLFCSKGQNKEYTLLLEQDLKGFLDECGEYVVSHRGVDGPFSSLLLDSELMSAVAYPFYSKGKFTGLLILNGREDFYYSKTRLSYLDSVCRVAQFRLDALAE
ncbi:MAG: hypothetical protein PQJ59_11430 [Spirochaetales bacterium]|nr:hypothetical protein [Spirochaetales bacterium]